MVQHGGTEFAEQPANGKVYTRHPKTGAFGEFLEITDSRRCGKSTLFLCLASGAPDTRPAPSIQTRPGTDRRRLDMRVHLWDC